MATVVAWLVGLVETFVKSVSNSIQAEKDKFQIYVLSWKYTTLSGVFKTIGVLCVMLCATI